MEAEPAVAVCRVRVKPRQCDAQGMVHAIRYYEFFEDGFLEWLDRFAGGYGAVRADGVDLVIRANGCDYRGSARLDDILVMEVAPTRIGRTSLSMSFTMRREQDGGTVVIGHATYVAVAGAGAVDLPERLRRYG
ncbi:acyl-CoA thioesterase [Actinomadura sp.]|jgi:YbgC/YbaW family acyl-CoA thioester hydrolase|uniref:acyl-CoA thioesterase n=1 Tax=Actinomadura sp. TaxID=1989 RepID=UPI00335C9C09